MRLLEAFAHIQEVPKSCVPAQNMVSLVREIVMTKTLTLESAGLTKLLVLQRNVGYHQDFCFLASSLAIISSSSFVLLSSNTSISRIFYKRETYMGHPIKNETFFIV